LNLSSNYLSNYLLKQYIIFIFILTNITSCSLSSSFCKCTYCVLKFLLSLVCFVFLFQNYVADIFIDIFTDENKRYKSYYCHHRFERDCHLCLRKAPKNFSVKNQDCINWPASSFRSYKFSQLFLIAQDFHEQILIKFPVFFIAVHIGCYKINVTLIRINVFVVCSLGSLGLHPKTCGIIPWDCTWAWIFPSSVTTQCELADEWCGLISKWTDSKNITE
jgi:hypothetical protein